MSLATDALIKKATTTTTNLAALIPIIWASQLEVNLRRRAVLEQSLLVNTDLLVPNSGDRVYVPGLPDIAAADDLTEGTDMTIYALSNAAYVVLTPAERGKTIEITRKALDRIKYDGMAAIVDRLAYSMSIKIENMVAALYNATANGTLPSSQTVFAGGNPTTIPTLYPNGHATGTVVAADSMNASMLSQGVAQLQQYDVMPFSDGAFMLFLTPDAWQSLIMDANVRNDLRYAAPSELISGFNGYKGTLYGVNCIVTNFIVDAVENTSIRVKNNLLVSERWAAIAYKRRPEIFVDPTLYDGGRRRRFGITADFDVQLLHADRAVVLKSAKQF